MLRDHTGIPSAVVFCCCARHDLSTLREGRVVPGWIVRLELGQRAAGLSVAEQGEKWLACMVAGGRVRQVGWEGCMHRMAEWLNGRTNDSISPAS